MALSCHGNLDGWGYSHTSALLCKAVYGIMDRDGLPAPVAVTAL